MSDRGTHWDQMVQDLGREIQELRLRAHLARAEVRDELSRLEEKLAEYRLRAHAARTEARDAMEGVGEAARRLATEIREGLDRIRKTF